MTSFIALLRGINVSGQKQIRMADLLKRFKALGFEDARNYLQSGNVVFRSRRSNVKKLASAIQADIAEAFGHQVDVLVLSAGELNRIAASNPLPKLGRKETLFHATFLFQPILKTDFEKLVLPAQEGERAVLIDQVVFLYCPHGYGRTKLNNAFFERKLGVPATTRNWRTVLALRDLCEER
ncbi:MAG: DUF1697 domain-containing protein [Nitrospirae bacterium]|nr:DUF1697 domain-containing protein [Candidatus Manganitrophaceae bacterium]